MEVAEGEDLWAIGDPGSVAQILRILLDNALAPYRRARRCARRGHRPRRAGRHRGAGRGAGVAADDRERIFERFERARGRPGGVGLGPRDRSRLARQMGGDLVLDEGPAARDSSSGCRSPRRLAVRFQVRPLPCAADACATAVASRAARRRVLPAGRPGGDPPGRGRPGVADGGPPGDTAGVLRARPGSTVRVSVPVAGQGARSALVHLPKGRRSGQVPLLLALHGAYGNGAFMERYSGLSRLADRVGFGVVYPDAAGPRWRITAGKGNADVEFLDTVLDRVLSGGCFDDRRVSAVGVSNGAGMAARFACAGDDRLAGLVSVAGGYGWLPACQARPPLRSSRSTGRRTAWSRTGGDRRTAGATSSTGSASGSITTAASAWRGARSGARTSSASTGGHAAAGRRSRTCGSSAPWRAFVSDLTWACLLNLQRK